MTATPDRPNRRSIRLPGYDYTSPGYYFVTLCTSGRFCMFGDVVDDVVVLNDLGRIAEEEWQASTGLRKEIELDRYVVMPNHLHGLVFFRSQNPLPEEGADPAAQPCQRRPRRSLGSFIAGFKSAVTRRINRRRSSAGGRVWQRNYWEHVVRSERALDAIRRYIDNNPARWSFDRYHPNPSGIDPIAREAWRLLKEPESA